MDVAVTNSTQPILIIGPTATGKSDLAVEVALRVGGEVISADSRQVYQGLDIGAGKITVAEMKGVPHHLLDIASPVTDTYSVAQYQSDARKIYQEILQRNKVPIICGGTGYYVDALLYTQSFPNVPQNTSLRHDLASKNVEELQHTLSQLDPDALSHADTTNHNRLIRAIEVVTALGSYPVSNKTQNIFPHIIYLDYPSSELQQRITDRLEKRLQTGMLAEAEKLLHTGVTHEKLQSFGLEYRYQSLYLQNNITLSEMKEQIIIKSLQFAKRQRTWFKRYATLLNN